MMQLEVGQTPKRPLEIVKSVAMHIGQTLRYFLGPETLQEKLDSKMYRALGMTLYGTFDRYIHESLPDADKRTLFLDAVQMTLDYAAQTQTDGGGSKFVDLDFVAINAMRFEQEQRDRERMPDGSHALARAVYHCMKPLDLDPTMMMAEMVQSGHDHELVASISRVVDVLDANGVVNGQVIHAALDERQIAA